MLTIDFRTKRVDPKNVVEYAAMLASRIDTTFMLAWLNAKEDVERKLLERVAELAIDTRDMMQENLAIQISNKVGELFKK